MKNNKEVLSSILKTTQMGQIGIRSVLDHGMSSDLRVSLESQLKEFDAIETEAHILASQRGWEVPELDPSVRAMTNMTTRMKLTGKNTESKIAGMMILGNVRGKVKQLKNIHQFSGTDDRLRALNQKLLDTETANIQQMESYL